MKKQASIIVLFIVLGVFLVACQPGLEREISQGEELWQEQGITNYEIKVRMVDSIWHAQTHTLLVENGAVSEATANCIPAPFEGAECEVREFDAATYTVPGLFAIAREEAARSDGQWTTIEFDEQYGFPTRISFNDPEILDEDRSWQVMRFVANP